MRALRLAAALTSLAAIAVACSAGNDGDAAGVSGANNGEGGGQSSSSSLGAGAGKTCDYCATQSSYLPCVAGKPGDPVVCPEACANDLGCVACVPGGETCVGNDVQGCKADGTPDGNVVETCGDGQACSNGACKKACDVAAEQPSNVGCEFWAVDLDQQDGGGNDPASAPWGVVLSNAGTGSATVTIEINEAAVGDPIMTTVVQTVTIAPGKLAPVTLPTRELDCGVKPNDYKSPGTCLSSRAYRITASSPIVVYQFNVFANAYSNDASLLLPTTALGKLHRIIGWVPGHPILINFPGLPKIIDRSYVTIVGTDADTEVTVNPTWRIKGNDPIAATAAGGEIKVTIGAFDVLNLETDDATMQDDPKTAGDLSGTVVQSTKPVAVFSGTESTYAPGDIVDIPKKPGWTSDDTCCLDHLEDQILPIESIGSHYVIGRSPVRSTSSYREPDVIRFLGVAEVAHVTTNLPPPLNDFTLQPGEVRTTYAQNNLVATGDKPFMIGQILISNAYVDGPAVGDPSLTVMPPVEQYRNDYVILSPSGWSQSWIVFVTPTSATVFLDGQPTGTCIVEPAGTVAGETYESRRCKVAAGAHTLHGDKPFGIVAYGYGSAGSYALAGGANVKKVYVAPPIH